MSKYARLIAFFVISVLLFPAISFGADGMERVRLGIMKFESKTYDVSDRTAGAITDIFGRILFRSKGIMLVERERLDEVMQELRLGQSGLVDENTAAEIGKLAGCDYMLMGSITNLAKASSGVAVPLFVIPVAVGTKNEKVKATLDVRLVKVDTGEIVFAETADGTASKSDTALSAYGVSLANSEFGGIEGTAVTNATMALAPKIEKELTGEDTLTKILDAEKKAKSKKAKASKSSKSKSEGSSASVSRPKKGKASKASAEEETTSGTDTPAAGSNATVNRPKKNRTASAPTETTAEETTSGTDTPAAGTNATVNRPKKNRAASTPVETPSETAASTPSETPIASSSVQYENESTDPEKVIAGYGLSAGEARVRKLAHTNAAKLGNRSKKAYDKYVELAGSYENDYLAAYRAGLIAMNLKRKKDAVKWIDKALEINPDYVPAKEAKAKL